MGISKFENMFKHHRCPKAIILHAVYPKLRFTLSYRDVEELMKIRGVEVDHDVVFLTTYMQYCIQEDLNRARGLPT